MTNDFGDIPIIKYLRKNLPVANIKEPTSNSNAGSAYIFTMIDVVKITISLYQNLTNPYFDTEVYYMDGKEEVKIILPDFIYSYVHSMLADTLINYWKTKNLLRKEKEKEMFDNLNNILRTSDY